MRSDALGLFWEDRPVVKEAKAAPPKRTPPERTWERPDYLPGLKEAITFDVPLLSDDELLDIRLQASLKGENARFSYDVESYPNYFLCGFQDVVSRKVVQFELAEIDGVVVQSFNRPKMQWIVDSFCQVGFNSLSYDETIITLALAGCTPAQMWEATKLLIVDEMRPSDVLRRFKVKRMQFDHIDLIEVAPLRASLKIYGGRLHTKKMQDLPFVPGTVLNLNQMCIVKFYNVNDLGNTSDLHDSLKEQLSLRYSLSNEYKIDLRSKSDAQIAEAVLGNEIEALNGARAYKPSIDIGTVYRYNVPSFLKYQTPLMRWVLATVASAAFVVGESGAVGMPPELAALKINIGGSTYQMGIGGLHSTESSAVHVEDADNILKDVDVESYYPRIILNQGLYPRHLGPNFLRVYDMIVQRRIAAKHAGDKVTADSLKITINGSFGKLGSKWSILYAPDLLIQVTISGQLSLLMLIERLELCGIPVVSANTDGIVIKCPRNKQELCDYVVKCWEQECGYKTEETRYAALYSRDVNNYVAVKKKFDKVNKVWLDEVDGAKTKGAFAPTGLQKNPTNYVCVQAVVNLLTKRKPIYETIKECTDITKFVSVRTVSGGAVKVYEYEAPPVHNTKEELIRLAGWHEVVEGFWATRFSANMGEVTTDQAYEYAKVALSKPKRIEFLGKSIRWYYAKGAGGELVYAKNGNKVPKSDGAKPLMQLPEQFPEDIDYDWYIKETETMLGTLGYLN